MRSVFAIPVLLTLLLASPTAAAPDPLATLDFLLGDWRAESAGPKDASGSSAFTKELQGRAIVRTSFAAYPAAGGRPASRHDDLMVIHAAGGEALRADYYDSEGHAIRYAVSVPATGEAVFLSDSIPGAPRYRLSYRLLPDGVLDGRFDVAPPGKPDSLANYLSWRSRKVSAPRARPAR